LELKTREPPSNQPIPSHCQSSICLEADTLCFFNQRVREPRSSHMIQSRHCRVLECLHKRPGGWKCHPISNIDAAISHIDNVILRSCSISMLTCPISIFSLHGHFQIDMSSTYLVILWTNMTLSYHLALQGNASSHMIFPYRGSDPHVSGRCTRTRVCVRPSALYAWDGNLASETGPSSHEN